MWNMFVEKCAQQRAARQGFESTALLLVRLVVGYSFVIHGWLKLSRGPDKFGHVLEYLGVPLPTFLAWVTTLVELLGGIALILGAFVVVLSVPLIVIHLVAMFTIHIHYGFTAVKITGLSADGLMFGPPGFAISLLNIVGVIMLATFGAGALSVDRWFGGRATAMQR